MNRSRKILNLFESKIYYHAAKHEHDKITLEGAKGGSAFGKGIYLSTLPEDALTWGKVLYEIEVKGSILELKTADLSTIKKFEKVLGTTYYSDRFKKGDDEVMNIELYYALERKFPGRMPDILKKLGYVGMEHATPRMQYRNTATNIVVYDPKNIRIKKVVKHD